jgi:probable phosphoglycerate mutase
MSSGLPRVYLARHGETAWSVTGRHIGLTVLPLTERGERNARRLGKRLKGHSFALVLASPLRRAWRTCELSGWGELARIDDDLVEWNYGAYEGMTPEEIRRQHPGWEIFRDGCPQGESISDVTARAERILGRLRGCTQGDALLFSSAHLLRVLAACWLRLDPIVGRYLFLDTAALSILGCHADRDDPVIYLWNDCSHASVEATQSDESRARLPKGA